MIRKFLVVLFILVSISSNAQDEQDTNDFDLTTVDSVPVAPGCDQTLSNEELKACFTKYVSKIAVENIRMEFIENQSLEVGKHEINITFTINNKGRICNVSTDSKNNKIDKHFIKAIKEVDKMKPAIIDEQPVGIQYKIPIRFEII